MKRYEYLQGFRPTKPNPNGPNKPATPYNGSPVIKGEITPDGGVHRRTTPRIVGPDNVDTYKALMGICGDDGCCKIAGHPGPCKGAA